MDLSDDFLEREISRLLNIIELNCDRFNVEDESISSEEKKNSQTESGGKSVNREDA